MNDAANAQELMRLCFPVGPGGAKDAWNRAHATLGWSYRRIRAVWYGEAARIDHHEMKELENAKTASFVARLHGHCEAMRTADPEFFEEEIRAIQSVARALSQKALAHGPQPD